MVTVGIWCSQEYESRCIGTSEVVGKPMSDMQQNGHGKGQAATYRPQCHLLTEKRAMTFLNYLKWQTGWVWEQSALEWHYFCWGTDLMWACLRVVISEIDLGTLLSRTQARLGLHAILGHWDTNGRRFILPGFRWSRTPKKEGRMVKGDVSSPAPIFNKRQLCPGVSNRKQWWTSVLHSWHWWASGSKASWNCAESPSARYKSQRYIIYTWNTQLIINTCHSHFLGPSVWCKHEHTVGYFSGGGRDLHSSSNLEAAEHGHQYVSVGRDRLPGRGANCRQALSSVLPRCDMRGLPAREQSRIEG